MNNNFKIEAIENNFNELFNLSKEELFLKGIVKIAVDEKPGFPCRVTLKDAEIGEEVLLLSFKYHNVNSPYKASGPIFIRKNSKKVNLKINEVPQILFERLQSVRVYDKNGMMIDAKILERREMEREIKKTFNNTLVSYIQVHNANPGCYNCQVNRVL
ncbi:Protein of unknown function [Tenacibaculum sp. MAR_2010_89]|uniref:DUF1203 domain-containing protein n=1 Tax=Tenacibaculum sp. MAR_2010_89 TaxID=1250198 RepID=UPI00089D50C0|nr:DUF1203 domain-containing protein [Tenacibaculum sp. MAR_2010_89]SEE34143.1 Protein of unknown function [Tenacibaculum sp. MAR_2010_89]